MNKPDDSVELLRAALRAALDGVSEREVIEALGNSTWTTSELEQWLCGSRVGRQPASAVVGFLAGVGDQFSRAAGLLPGDGAGSHASN